MIPPGIPEDHSGFLPAGGNYQELKSYKKAEIIYDLTFCFCERFLKRGERTTRRSEIMISFWISAKIEVSL